MRLFYSMDHGDSQNPSRATGGFDLPQLVCLFEQGLVEEWPTLELSIAGQPVDYLVNDASVRLCSPRLREVIDSNCGEHDQRQWLDAAVTTERSQVLEYYVLHFPSLPDVLDPEQTLMNGLMVVRPVISLRRAEGHRVFGFRWGGMGTVVARPLKLAIEQAGCTGVGFENIRLA